MFLKLLASLFILISLSSTALGQSDSVEGEGVAARSEKNKSNMPVSLENSPSTSIMSDINADNQDFKLAETSTINSTPAGMCEVVNGLLADFCATYPDDISCQF